MKSPSEPPPLANTAVPLLQATSLIAGYDGTSVCGEVSFELHPGDSVAIVGSNGAGKSTMVRTLGGQQPAVAGKALLDGRPVDERTAAYRRTVAAVFDEDAFFPALTVAEHLLMTAWGHQTPEPESAVVRELAFFGLSSHGDAMPHSLSSGQRRRLLLASAFIRPFRLLILDEPEQRLDPVMRQKLAARLRGCASEGSAVLVVTHDPQLLTVVADRCILIDDDVAYLSPERAADVISA